MSYSKLRSFFTKLSQTNIKLWHLIVIAVVIAISRVTPVQATSPFFNGGVFVESTVNNTPLQTVVGQSEVTHISKDFTIQSGKVATLIALYTTQSEEEGSGGCQAEMRLDSPTGTILGAGETILGDSGNDREVKTLTTTTPDIPAGNHTIYVTVEPVDSPYTGSNACLLSHASLTLIGVTQ